MYGKIQAKAGNIVLIDSPIKQIDGDNTPDFDQSFDSSAEADMKDGIKIQLKFWDKDLLRSDYLGGTSWVKIYPGFDLTGSSSTLEIGGPSQYCDITYRMMR